MQYARVSDAGFSRMWAVFNLGLMPFLFGAGYLLDIFGWPVLLTLGSTLLIFGCMLLIYHQEPRSAQIALMLWGAGAACLCVTSIIWMPTAFFSPTELPAALNFGMVFFALGALIAPTLVEVLLRGLGWQRGLWVLAGLTALPPILAWILHAPAPTAPHPSANRFDLFGDPVLWLATLAFFLYAPLEGTMSAWFTRWVRDLGHEPRRANSLLTMFWSAFLASRLVVAYALHLYPSFSEGIVGWLLAGLALLASILLGNLASTTDRGRGTFLVLLVGVLLGPIFPTLLALVMSRFQSSPGLALGTVVGLGSLGSLLLVPLLSVSLRQDSAHKMMRWVMLLGVLMAGFVVWFTVAL